MLVNHWCYSVERKCCTQVTIFITSSQQEIVWFSEIVIKAFVDDSRIAAKPKSIVIIKCR